MAQVQVENERKRRRKTIPNSAAPRSDATNGRKEAQALEKKRKRKLCSENENENENQTNESTSNSSYANPSTINSLLTSTSAPAQNSVYHIFTTLLFFNVFFDLSLCPILETYLSPNQQGSLNLQTRMHISLFRQQLLSSLLARITENPLGNSAETLYNLYIEVLNSQGFMFVNS